ncbi:MAG: aspartate carbamoyltransferase regulatory subunit [Clostridia bacterium]|nr:aspartate carbamoyltransferase regulatory subunit [Clostridia bacterium]
MNIDKIKNGYVIDHIKAGNAMKIYEYLELDKLDCSVAIIKNAKSYKTDKKDIIKIDELIELDLNVLGYCDSGITVNIIKDDKIVEKITPDLPEILTNVARCKNPRCITSIEQELPQVSILTDRKNKTYRCKYCESKI